jgi:hypothetical protein
MAELTTLQAAREAVAADLRQFFKSTIQNVAGAVLTVDATRDFAPDKFRLRDWYALLSDAYTNAVTLNGAIDNSQTTGAYTTAAGDPQVGDVVQIDSEQMLILTVNAGANSLTWLRGYNGTIPAAHSNGAAITRAHGAWRPVASADPTVGTVSLNRAFSSAPAVGDPIALYGIMEPPAWTDCVQEALKELPRRERYTTALVASTWEYALPTWVQIGEQVKQVFLRKAAAGEQPREWPVQYIPLETANGVTIQLATLPDVTDTSLVVIARRYYDALATDASTTTCPFRELRTVAAEKAAERILHELGGSGKEVFGVSMAVIRAKAEKARLALLQQSSITDYSLGHTSPLGPVPLTSGYDW